MEDYGERGKSFHNALGDNETLGPTTEEYASVVADFCPLDYSIVVLSARAKFFVVWMPPETTTLIKSHPKP